MKIQILVHDDSVDTLAMMLVGYVLHMPKEEPNYQKKVEVVVEFLEETLDPSFNSVAIYFHVLGLMPEMVKRKLPFHIEEFVRMYERQIEEALGGPIPSKYKPNRIVEKPKVILDQDGNIISALADGPIEVEPKKGLVLL